MKKQIIRIVILAGFLFGSMALAATWQTVPIDTSGNMIWGNNVNVTGTLQVTGAVTDPNGNKYSTSTSGGGSGNGNVFVSPTSSVLANNFIFYTTAGSSTISATSVVQQVAATGINVTGTLQTTATTTIGTATNNQFSVNPTTVKSYVVAGSSTNATTIGGTLSFSATSTGNGAGASTTIESYTIPTSTYLTVGDEIDLYAGGTFANTAATDKQLQIVVASTTVFDTGAAFAPANAACNWFVESRGMLTAVTSTIWATTFTDSCVSALTDDSGDAGNKSVTVTSTAPISVKLYGKGTNASDIVANYFRILYAPF